MGPIELVYDYFEDHVRAAGVVNEKRPVALGVLCFLVGGVSFFVAQAASHRLRLLSFTWAACALVAFWRLATGFLLAAVIHMVLSMGGIFGSAESLFVLFGLADLAWALAVPLVLLARLASAGSWAGPVVFLAVGLLTLSLKARALQDNYRIPSGRAWLTLSLPYLAFLVAGLLAFSLAVAAAAVQLFHLFAS